jgi:hypothetical protein
MLKKRINLIFGGVFAVAACILWLWSPFSPWVRCDYIDLHTGRFRTARYFAFVKIHEKVTETDISKLWKRYFGPYPEADWQIWARFAGGSGRSIPDYQTVWNVYTWDLEIGTAFDAARFDETIKQKVIRSYIGFLEKRDPMSAGEYVSDVYLFAIDRRDQAITNAPSWLTEPEFPYRQKITRGDKRRTDEGK